LILRSDGRQSLQTSGKAAIRGHASQVLNAVSEHFGTASVFQLDGIELFSAKHEVSVCIIETG